MKVRAKKSLGQNFLVDGNYQQKIVSAVSKVLGEQTLLEIGPGQGAITQHFFDKAKNIVLVEKDRELAQRFQDQHSDNQHVKIYSSDVLKLDLNEILNEEKAIALGNLPYNVSTQILIQLFEAHKHFSHLFLMFQKEVAQRCLAKVGTGDYGPLALWVQYFSKGENLFHLPPTAFKPQPKVTSSFVHFEIKSDVSEKAIPVIQFARQFFQKRRKKVRTVLKGMFDIDKINGFEDQELLEKRPEVLKISDFEALYDWFF